MPKWTVELTPAAERRLREDFKRGLISADDIKVIKRWIADVEDLGLKVTQQKTDWRDHQLDGEWTGYRAISFSYSGRVIYHALKGRIVVEVVRVTPDHDYRK